MSGNKIRVTAHVGPVGDLLVPVITTATVRQLKDDIQTYACGVSCSFPARFLLYSRSFLAHFLPGWEPGCAGCGLLTSWRCRWQLVSADARPSGRPTVASVQRWLSPICVPSVILTLMTSVACRPAWVDSSIPSVRCLRSEWCVCVCLPANHSGRRFAGR
jgi:hypothetical protein